MYVHKGICTLIFHKHMHTHKYYFSTPTHTHTRMFFSDGYTEYIYSASSPLPTERERERGEPKLSLSHYRFSQAHKCTRICIYEQPFEHYSKSKTSSSAQLFNCKCLFENIQQFLYYLFINSIAFFLADLSQLSR